MTVLAQTHAQQVRQMDDPESQGSALESISGMPAWPTAFRHGLHVAAAEHCQLCERCIRQPDSARRKQCRLDTDGGCFRGAACGLREPAIAVARTCNVSPRRSWTKYLLDIRYVRSRLCPPCHAFTDSERTRNLIDVRMDVMAG